MKKVLFISSTGGHLSEMLQLKDMFNRYDYKIITEKTKSNLKLKKLHLSTMIMNTVRLCSIKINWRSLYRLTTVIIYFKVVVVLGKQL